MGFISDRQAQQTQNSINNTDQNKRARQNHNTTPYYYLAPLSGFDIKDMTELVKGINEYLTSIGKDISNLSQTGTAPVNGNLFASISATSALLVCLNSTQPDYTALTIDLLGCLSEEGNNEANLVTILRPILHKVRDAYLRQPKEGKGKNPLKASDITLFNDHMHTLNAGELKKAVEVAQSQINNWLSRANKLAQTSLNDLLLPPVSPTNPVPQLSDPIASKEPQNWYAPTKPYTSIWQAVQSVSGQKAVHPTSASKACPEFTKQITKLQTTLAKEIKAQSGTKEIQIGFLLQKLNEALKSNSEVLKTTAIIEGQPARVIEEKKEGVFEALASVCPTEANPDCSESQCNTRVGGSIGLALGEEYISHTDFVAPVGGLVWSRDYRSNLITYTKTELGARWFNQYLLRIDIRKNEWLLHTIDGRIETVPQLNNVGDYYHGRIESFNMLRLTEELVGITYNHSKIKIFKKMGKHFRLDQIRYLNETTTRFTYNTQQQLEQIIDESSKQALLLEYNQNKQIQKVWLTDLTTNQQLKVVAEYQYDQKGNLITAIDEHQDKRTYEYDDYHRLTRYTDRTDFGMNLQWQGRRHKARAIREYADDGSQEVNLNWYAPLRNTTVTNALGQSILYFNDIKGYPARTIYPDGSEEWFFRDARKNIIKQINTDGRATSFTYDFKDMLTCQIENDSSKTFFEYNDKDQLVRLTNANGHVWRYEYDKKGNLLKSINPKQAITENIYNDKNQLVATINAKGGKTQYQYNDKGQLIQQTDCSGKSTTYSYNANGQLASIKNAVGAEVQYSYNHRGQQSKVTYPDGHFITYQYDAEGRLLSSKDHLGQENRTEYNSGYYPYSSIDPLGRRTKVHPDKLGKPLQLTDANGAIYQWQYDSKTNEVLQETNFSGKSTHYHYDEHTGELIQIQEQGANPIHYEYDEMGRITRLYNDNLNHQFMYDQMGQLIQTQNPYSKNQYFYDRTGNLIKEIQEITRLGESTQTDKYIKRYIWYHEYDVLGNRITTIRPDGQRIDYLIYGSGHIHGILLNQQPLADFERDDLHREIARRYANKIEQQYTFDKTGYLKQFNLAGEYNPQTKQQVVNKKEYRYNNQGLISQIFDDTRGNQTYDYDLVGRLIHAQNIDYNEQFQYDSANNLLDPLNSSNKTQENYAGNYDLQGKFRDKITTTDYQNQIDKKTGLPKIMGNMIKEFNGNQYRYDPRGNLIQKADATGITTYEWNDLNQLTKLINTKGTTYYRYDTLGRRIYKQTPDGKETYYLWEGDLMVMEDSQNHIRHYIYEPDSFAPLVQFDTNAENNPVQVYFYHNDHLGTPELMSDEVGELVWMGTKTAYGQMYEQTSAIAKLNNVSNPIRFQGQYFDMESGLHYNRFRYYDPETGRYLSEDPIKLAGGMNLYGYPTNPVHGADPMGLYTVTCQYFGENLPYGFNVNSKGKCFGDKFRWLSGQAAGKAAKVAFGSISSVPKGAYWLVNKAAVAKQEVQIPCELKKEFDSMLEAHYKRGHFRYCNSLSEVQSDSACIREEELESFLITFHQLSNVPGQYSIQPNINKLKEAAKGTVAGKGREGTKSGHMGTQGRQLNDPEIWK